MDLFTDYMGLKLNSPFIAGASPLSKTNDGIKRLEDAGAAAVILPSLFEEEIIQDQKSSVHEIDSTKDQFAEALTYLPEPKNTSGNLNHYLEIIRKAKEETKIPVIASLNGISNSGWIDYAKNLEQAGTDALELNIYHFASDPGLDGRQVEKRTLEIARTVKNTVNIPVSLKLSPYYSSIADICSELDKIGIDGLVIFNRFYQPHINIEKLEIDRQITLSDQNDLPLRLSWAGILYGKVRASLAVTGGIHFTEDTIKALMCGADAIQMVSSLLQRGPEHIKALKKDLEIWLERHKYNSLDQLIGSMSISKAPNPEAYMRVNYMRLLKSWPD